MKMARTEMSVFQEILERRAAELVQVLRKRDGIAIEKSADQMDEIQYASERDLAMRNVDRESSLLRQVKAALRRIHDGSFGVCIECELAISPKRLTAVPCIALYSVPGRCRSGWAGKNGICKRDSRQCGVNERFCARPVAHHQR